MHIRAALSVLTWTETKTKVGREHIGAIVGGRYGGRYDHITLHTYVKFLRIKKILNKSVAL